MDVINTIRTYLSQVGFLPVIVVTAGISMYVFWLESKRTNKDQNSIFDCFFTSSIVTIVWGRISYLLANPGNYEGIPWSIVPYEKYPDGLYFFRLLPWRYLSIWDGEFLFTGLLVGFVFSAMVFVILGKRWRWREMMAAVIAPATIPFGILLLIVGFVTQQPNILIQGAVLAGATILYLIGAKIIQVAYKSRDQKIWEKYNYILVFVYSALIFVYTPLTILRSEITYWDRINMYVFVGIGVISLLYFVIDVFNNTITIESKYKTRSVSISTNQPVKV